MSNQIPARPHPAPAPRLNTQPKECTCEDCQRFRKEECPYPGSNITMDRCNSFLINLAEHDAAISRDAYQNGFTDGQSKAAIENERINAAIARKAREDVLKELLTIPIDDCDVGGACALIQKILAIQQQAGEP